jgi:hypothetical protein
MKRRLVTPTLSLSLILAQVLAPLPAHAQSDEQRAAARELAGEGADAFDQGRYQDAIDRFTRAESLVHALPHLLFLARSHAKVNQYVKAREAYMKIMNEALPPNATQGVRDAQSSAQSEISQVEAKIGRLTVQVQGKEQAKDLVVQVNGVAVPGVLVGAPQPIDPGDHKVEAVATGFRAAPQSVTVGEGERKEVVLTLASDPNAAPPVVPGAETPAPGEPVPAGPMPPPGDSPPTDTGTGGGSSGMRIGSYVAFGVGAVGLGLGTVFLIQRSGKQSEIDDLCGPGDTCDASQVDESEVKGLESDRDSAGMLSVVGFVVGGVGIATGVTLLVLSSGSSGQKAGGSRPDGVRVSPWVTKNTFGVKGSF